MTDLVEGTVSHEHKFDGCMYGLKSQFQETPKPIKKPWKIVTWGVSFRSFIEDVIAVMTMLNVPVGKLALLKFTLNG